MNRQEYLDQVCSLIRFEAVRPQVRKELESHLDEVIEELKSGGKGPQEAAQEAMLRLGPAEQLGQELDRTHRPRFEWSILLITGVLTSLGLLALYGIQSRGLSQTGLSYFNISIISTIMGSLLLLGLSLWDYYKLRPASGKLYGAVIFICILSLFIDATQKRPYLSSDFMPVNLIIATPFLFLVALAGIFSRPGWQWNTRGWGKALILLLIPLCFYFLNASFPACILFVGVSLALVRFSGANWKQTAGLAAIVFSPIIMLFAKPYRLERLTAFLHPGSDSGGQGYVYIQLHSALANVNFFGSSTTSLFHIPNLHDNFIFAYVVCTFGWLVGALVVGLAFALIYRLFKAADSVKDSYGRLLVQGAGFIMTFEFSWNLLMTFGFLPILNIPLPFISFGSSIIFSQMLLLGLVMSAYRRRILEREEDSPLKPVEYDSI